MFERNLPSLVASFATTFHFPPGRSREAKDYRPAGVERPLYCTLNREGTMIKVVPISQSGDSELRGEA